jgi:hypothetical protein
LAPSAKVTARIDRAAGATIAAPKPCRARAPIRSPAAREQGGRTEQCQSRQEHAAAPHQVGHPAAEQQESAEHEAVRDDDPLQGALPDAEIALDRGQGDIHDRDIEHDHELGRA